MTTLVETYTKIAGEFDASRYRVWPCVKKFLESQSTHSFGLELGSGNGKNITFRNDLVILGYDFCFPFCKLVHDKGYDCIQADITKVPFKNDSFDFTMSVAVIHHLDSIDKRINMIKECIRITKPGGTIFLSAWALKQDLDSKHKFNKADTMVPWKARDGITYYRYYHMFIKNEFESLVKSLNVSIIESYREKSNYIIVLQTMDDLIFDSY